MGFTNNFVVIWEDEMKGMYFRLNIDGNFKTFYFEYEEIEKIIEKNIDFSIELYKKILNKVVDSGLSKDVADLIFRENVITVYTAMVNYAIENNIKK